MIGERLKEIRERLALTQSEFGLRIGLKKSGISTLESGKTKLTEGNLKLICSEFNVSENWLRAGEGEMFDPLKNDIDYLVGRYGDKLSPDVEAIINVMLTLDADQQREFESFVSKFLEARDKIKQRKSEQ